MKIKWTAGGLILVVLVSFAACSLFGGGGENVNSLTFSRDEVVLEVVPDYEMRTLAVVYYIDNAGVIGGDFFDRFDEIVAVFSDYSLDEGAEMAGVGKFVFSVNFDGGEVVDYVFAMGDSSEEFDLVESFYSDVAELFTEEVY